MTDIDDKGRGSARAIELDKFEVPEAFIYIFLKFRLLQAKINKSIGMSHECHDICNSIILFVKIFKDLDPRKFWLSALKAAQIQSSQLCVAKEFDAALVLLNKVGKTIIEKVNNHFIYSSKKDGKDKKLEPCYYSFNFRRY